MTKGERGLKFFQVILGDTSVPQEFSPSPLVDQVR